MEYDGINNRQVEYLFHGCNSPVIELSYQTNAKNGYDIIEHGSVQSRAAYYRY